MKKFRIPTYDEKTGKGLLRHVLIRKGFTTGEVMVEEIEAAIKGTDCTFSAFVVEAVRVALENLKEESE